MNLPLYKAKELDSGEWIETEDIFTHNGVARAAKRWTDGEISGYVGSVIFPITYKIDPETVSIHFPNWIDKNKNKIWASLDKNDNNLAMVSSLVLNGNKEDIKCRIYFNGIEFIVEAVNKKGLRIDYVFLSNLVRCGGTLGELEIIDANRL